MNHILRRSEHMEMSADSEDWISGWLNPLRHTVHFGLAAKPACAVHRDLLERLLDQTQYALPGCTAGLEAFRTFLHHVLYNFPSSSQLSLSEWLGCPRFRDFPVSHTIFSNNVWFRSMRCTP